MIEEFTGFSTDPNDAATANFRLNLARRAVWVPREGPHLGNRFVALTAVLHIFHVTACGFTIPPLLARMKTAVFLVVTRLGWRPGLLQT